MRLGRAEQASCRVPFRAQSEVVSSQSAQGADGPAKLIQIKVDQGLDGRTQPKVIIGVPERSTLPEGQVNSPTYQGHDVSSFTPD